MSVLKRQLFWNTVQGAMQLSTIIVLGRIFDDRSAHTVATLLRSAEDVGIFSKEELGRRKRGLATDHAEWLDDYLARAHETSTTDVRRLKKEAARWRSVYNEKYKPIRDRYYAHKELPHDSEELQKLFAGTRLEELKRVCMFLLVLGRVTMISPPLTSTRSTGVVIGPSCGRRSPF